MSAWERYFLAGRQAGCPKEQMDRFALAEVILPPLPDAFPKKRETVHATFLAIGPVQSMRETLTALKRAGLF